MSATTVSLFRKQFAQRVKAEGLSVEMWPGGNRMSNHLPEMSTSPQPTVLYVKVSNNAHGFSGLTKNQVARLVQSSVRWFAVFLHQAPKSRYLMSGGQILSRIDSHAITL